MRSAIILEHNIPKSIFAFSPQRLYILIYTADTRCDWQTLAGWRYCCARELCCYCCGEMKIAKFTLLILMFVLMLSIFVANVANIIDVDSHAITAAGSATLAESRWSKPRKYDIGDTADHLLWFLQVSCIIITFFIIENYCILHGLFFIIIYIVFFADNRLTHKHFSGPT